MSSLYFALNVPEERRLMETEVTLTTSSRLVIEVVPDRKMAGKTLFTRVHVKILTSGGNAIINEDYDITGRLYFSLETPTLDPDTYTILVDIFTSFSEKGTYSTTVNVYDQDGNKLASSTKNIYVDKYKIEVIPPARLDIVGDNEQVFGDEGGSFTFKFKFNSVPLVPCALPIHVKLKFYDPNAMDVVETTNIVCVGFWQPQAHLRIDLARYPDYVIWDSEQNQYRPVVSNSLFGTVSASTPYTVNFNLEIEFPKNITILEAYNATVNGNKVTITGTLNMFSDSIEEIEKDFNIAFTYNCMGLIVIKAKLDVNGKTEEKVYYLRIDGYSGPLAMWVIHPTEVPSGSNLRIKVVLHNATQPLAAYADLIEENGLYPSKYPGGGKMLALYLKHNAPIHRSPLVRIWKSSG